MSAAWRCVRLDKVKRPGGVFSFEMLVIEVEGDRTWLSYPRGARWQAPHDAGTMPFDAVLLVTVDPPSVTWWVDDPNDRRVEIDVCRAPSRTEEGWSYIDLELDPVRHEDSGHIEVEDQDEFEESLRKGWMSTADAEFALTRAAELEEALVQGFEPWGDEGWRCLNALRRTR